MQGRDCRTCTDKQKVTYGCNGNPKEIKEFNGERLKRCPRRAILDNPGLYIEVFRLYKFYQKGFLPYPGGIENQASKLVQYFHIMDYLLGKIEADRASEN